MIGTVVDQPVAADDNRSLGLNSYDSRYIDETEVIGNIYENPGAAGGGAMRLQSSRDHR
jgi:hypothetical protein